MRMVLLLNNFTNREGVGGNGVNAFKSVYIDHRYAHIFLCIFRNGTPVIKTNIMKLFAKVDL